jgi:hypothetical protein
MKLILTDWLDLGDCWYKYIENHSERSGDSIVGFISSSETEGYYDIFIWPRTINSEICFKNIDDTDERRVLTIKKVSTIESAFLKGNLKLISFGYDIQNIMK